MHNLRALQSRIPLSQIASVSTTIALVDFRDRDQQEVTDMLSGDESRAGRRGNCTDTAYYSWEHVPIGFPVYHLSSTNSALPNPHSHLDACVCSLVFLFHRPTLRLHYAGNAAMGIRGGPHLTPARSRHPKEPIASSEENRQKKYIKR